MWFELVPLVVAVVALIVAAVVLIHVVLGRALNRSAASLAAAIEEGPQDPTGSAIKVPEVDGFDAIVGPVRDEFPDAGDDVPVPPVVARLCAHELGSEHRGRMVTLWHDEHAHYGKLGATTHHQILFHGEVHDVVMVLVEETPTRWSGIVVGPDFEVLLHEEVAGS